MTTILTVGIGKDYSTVQGAFTALPSTLSDAYIIEIYSGNYQSESVVETIGTSSVNTLTIKQATGENVQLGTFTLNQSSGTMYVDFGPVDEIRTVTLNSNFSSTFTRCYFNGYPIVLSASLTYSNLTLINNIFYNTGGSTCIDGSATTGDHSIYGYHNTFQAGRNTIMSSFSTALDLKNNIFYNDYIGGDGYIIYNRSSSCASYVSDYNLHYNIGGVNSIYKPNNTAFSEATYFSSYEPNSINNQNPLLTNYIPDSSSPAVDNGTDVGISVDFIGASRPADLGYDIGAYELNGQIDFGESPLLCWTLIAQCLNSKKPFVINGPNKFPGLDTVKLPINIIQDTIKVIEDGKQII